MSRPDHRPLLPWLLIASAVAGVMTTPASAEAPWSQAETVGPEAASVDRPALVFTEDGRSALTWSSRNRFASERDTRSFVAIRDPDGRLVEVRPVASRLLMPVAYGRRHIALLRERIVSERAGRAPRVALSVSSGRAGNPLARSDRLATLEAVAPPAIAAGEGGEVAVAWIELRHVERARRAAFVYRFSQRRPGGRFSRPRTLGTGPACSLGAMNSTPSIELTYVAHDELLVAYTATRDSCRNLRIHGRTIRRGRPGRTEVIGVTDARVGLAAAASRRRAVILWGSQDGGEDPSRPWTVRIASRLPAQRAFGSPRILDRGEVREFAPEHVRVAVAVDGTATAMWSSVIHTPEPGSRTAVRVATASGQAPFGAFDELSSNGEAGDVAVASNGAFLVSWREWQDPPGVSDTGRIFAAVRSAVTDAFVAEPISEPRRTGSTSDAGVDAAFHPRASSATVVWAATLPGEGPAPGVRRAILALASRPLFG